MSLNLAEINNLKKKFDEVREQIRQPDYARAAYVRFTGEMMHIHKLKMDWLNPKFGEMVNKIKRPFGWRRLALRRMKNSALSNYDKDSLNSSNLYRRVGRMMGVFDNTMYCNMEFLPSEESYWEEVFKPFLDIDEETKTRILLALESIDLKRQRIEEWMEKQDYANLKQYRIGQAEKLDAVFTKDGSLSHNAKTSDIYGFLLMSGEPVRELGSREVIYEFMISCFGPDFTYEFEAFDRLCTHIKYCGTTYSASMKRARSVDRHKARVLTL